MRIGTGSGSSTASQVAPAGPFRSRRFGALAAVALFGATTSFTCETQTPPPASPDLGGVGGVELAVRVADNVNLAQVNFRISGNGIEPIEGQIPVTNLSATASAVVAGIADGENYRVELNATSADGGTSCAGTGTFDVRAGQNVSVKVQIQCRPRAAPAIGAVPTCGNHIVEPGEGCDPPRRDLCTQTCQTTAVCGNGTVEAGEECETPDGLTCGATCKKIVAGSGASGGLAPSP